MKKCLVVGAGGFGREVVSWALHVQQSEWELAGFLDSNPRALDGKDFPYQVVGDPAVWVPAADEVFISGLGDPNTRMRVCGGLKDRGARFVSLIHPTVVSGLQSRIGDGCVIAPYAVVSVNAVLEEFVLVNLAATIGHDSRVGAGSTISCHCDIMGYVTIGRCCFVGGHGCILPGKSVGEHAIVGAGSAVIQDVPAHTTVLGVPARVVPLPPRPTARQAGIE